MKKVRKFSNGGMDDYDSSDDAKNLIAAAEREASEANAPKAATAAPVQAPAMKMASFKEAFAEARKAGDKTFEWNGKKYTTEMAKPKASAKPAVAKPAEPKAPTFAEKQEAAGTKMRGAYRDAVGDIKRGIKSALSYNPRIQRERASMQEIDSNFKAGGKVSSASKRADGCAIRGKTRGRMM